MDTNHINKKTRKTLLSKQKTLICIFAAVVILLAVAYFFVLPNLSIFKGEVVEVLKKSEYGDEVEVSIYDEQVGKDITKDIEEMLLGTQENLYEVKKSDKEKVDYTFRKNDVTITYRPFVFPEIALDNIQEVIVENKQGTFAIYEYGGNFFIEGAERNLYNTSYISSLVLNARYMISLCYVDNKDGLDSYGLSNGKESAKVKVIDKNGNVNVVYIGDMTADGTFYVKHQNKKQIYLMDSGAAVFLSKASDFLNATVVRGIETQQRNYLDTFDLKKNGQEFFSCVRIPDEDRVGVYVNQLHKMTYPEPPHVLNTTTLYDMFEMACGMTGTAVVEYGISSKENKDELLDTYGLLSPSAEVEYTYDTQSYSFSVGNISPSGDYYVYSPYQDTIVTVLPSNLSFLDLEIIDLYQDNVFQYRIDFISEVEVTSKGESVVYVLEGTGESLSVTEKNSGKVIDVASFRQFYISLLNVSIGGYSSMGADAAEVLNHELTYAVKLRTGETIKFEFYSESPVNCYMIADGDGGFKTDRRYIDDIISKSDMLMKGITIESDF